MGTTYTVRYLSTTATPSQAQIELIVQEELDRVNLQMSTYHPDRRFRDSMQHDPPIGFGIPGDGPCCLTGQ